MSPVRNVTYLSGRASSITSNVLNLVKLDHRQARFLKQALMIGRGDRIRTLRLERVQTHGPARGLRRSVLYPSLILPAEGVYRTFSEEWRNTRHTVEHGFLHLVGGGICIDDGRHPRRIVKIIRIAE